MKKMKHTLKLASLILAALLLTACGDPKLDTSSDETMKKSMEVIMSELSEEKQKQFQKTVAGIYMAEAFSNLGGKKSKDEMRASVNAKLDGKTAEDLFAMAEEMKNRKNKK